MSDIQPRAGPGRYILFRLLLPDRVPRQLSLDLFIYLFHLILSYLLFFFFLLYYLFLLSVLFYCFYAYSVWAIARLACILLLLFI